MGRTRLFDEAQVLDAAAALFVRGGYEATSIDDLLAGLGMHRGSLYKAFGSKRGLFVHAVQRYVDQVLPARLIELAGDAERLTSGPDLDLLLVAALERGPVDAQVAALVRTALRRLSDALGAAEPAVCELLGRRLCRRLMSTDDR